MKKPASSTPQKPGVDEGSFQQLLQAAYVLQQHNERAQAGKPEEGYGRTLAGILEIQEQVRSQRMDFQAAASLVVRRLRELTHASGAAVGVLDLSHDDAYNGSKNQLNYYAASGSAAGEAGARLPIASTLAAECLHTGLVVQCPRAESDARLSPEVCQQLGVKALIASPINCQGKTVGVLELHFAEPDSFAEHDVRTCQMMSSLLAESIATDMPSVSSPPLPPLPEIPEIRALPTDRAALLAALEKLKPQLERLAGGSKTVAPHTPSAEASTPPLAVSKPASSPAPATTCEACGQALAQDELFCRSCGVARRGPNPWASLWEMQRTAEESAIGQSSAAAPPSAADSEAFDIYPSEVEDIVAGFANEHSSSSKVAPSRPPQIRPLQTGPPESTIDYVVPSLRAESEEETPAPLTWTFPRPGSFERADYDRDHQLASFGTETFPSVSDREALYPGEEPPQALEALELPEESEPEGLVRQPETTRSGFAGLADKWEKHRANIYVGLAGLVLLAVITGLIIPDQPAPPSATSAVHKGKTRVPPPPELSLMDKMLINLGLADAPEAPTDLGNPKAQVWIDVHTALYYCAGSDLYQKTPGGRLTTQADAQQDQFQPAGRKPCN